MAPACVVIAGPSGSGKTTWISQFLADPEKPAAYLCPGLADRAVDTLRIAYRFPWVQVLPEAAIAESWADLPDNLTVYLELGFHLDPNSAVLDHLSGRRVAVVPAAEVNTLNSEWHRWADEVVAGTPAPAAAETALPQLWRSPLTGQVFDPSSLDAVWLELTEGAYGQVHRAKGIFEMPDGRAFYVDFVQGLPGSEYTELNLPRWLEGRPQRLSGIEVAGWDLDTWAIAQAIRDCGLSDGAIAQYQQYYRGNLDAVEEVSV